MMDCPKCDSESLVETASLGNIPLDVCPACGGIWFDKGELEALLAQSQGGAVADLSLISPKPEGLSCPRCNSKMTRGGLVNPLLIVDKCEACGGVWLDAHELALVEKLLGVVGGKTEIHVSRPAPVPDTEAKPSGRTSLLKYSLGAVSLAGLAGFSYELFLYFSPAGSAGHAPSALLAGGSVLLLAGGILSINKLED